MQLPSLYPAHTAVEELFDIYLPLDVILCEFIRLFFVGLVADGVGGAGTLMDPAAPAECK